MNDSHSKTVDILLSTEMKCQRVRHIIILAWYSRMQIDVFVKTMRTNTVKLLRAIYAARSLAHGTIGRDIAPTVLLKIYKQIQPIINYSSEVCYDRKVNRRLGSLQTIYLKRALGVKVQTSNLAVFGETGRYPLILKQEKLVLGYWLKLMTIPTTNPLRIVYDELYRLSNASHITWCTYVGELLTSIALVNIWEGRTYLLGLALLTLS